MHERKGPVGMFRRDNGLPVHRPGIAVLPILCLLLSPVLGWAQEPYIVRPEVTDCVRVREDANTEAIEIACLAASTAVAVVSSRKAAVPDPLPEDLWMTMHFIDVGQGDAIWINTPDDGLDGNGIFEGRNIVIDGGP